MKEIKFRFWDGTTGNRAMCYQNSTGRFEYSSGFTISFQTAYEEANDTQGYNKPKSLMQFTGLLDKNGKEIYESDLITFAMPNNKARIVWDDKHARFGMQLIDKKGELFGQIDSLDGSFEVEAEVIGNIYENEELLK